MRRLVAFLAVAALFATGGVARAEFITGFTGNTQTIVGNNRAGTVNFAVFRNVAGSWDDGITNAALSALFTPGDDDSANNSPGLDVNAQFLYVYQVVNNNGNAGGLAINGLGIEFPYVNLTSWGFANNAVLADDVGPVTTSNNLGTNDSSWVPGSLNTTQAGDVDITALTSSLYRNVLSVTWVVGSRIDSTILNLAVTGATNRGSYLILLTSNDEPYFDDASVSGGGQSSGFGQVPVPNPEPTSMALMGMGLLGLCGYGWKKRKQTA